MMDIIKISSPDAKGTANLNIVTEGIDIYMYSTGKIEKLIPEKVTNKVNYYYETSAKLYSPRNAIIDYQ